MGISKRKPPVAVSVKTRQGFTIVELLVVIAVIGILLALLLPAVQSARESGRKTACMSNAYQLGMAVNRYDQDKGKVPGWANSLGGRDVSWPVMSLPYIERNDLYSEWADPANSSPSGGSVGVFRCPSAQVNAGNLSPLSYAGNCGNQGDASPSLYCGVMADNTATAYSLEDVSDGDGTATTLLFGERVMGAGYDIQKDWGQYNIGAFNYGVNGTVNSGGYIEGYPAFGLPFGQPAQALRSAHVNGSVVAFCDGHTYFLGNEISPSVYTQLVTSNGGRLPTSGTNSQYKVAILNEGDY